MATMYYVVSVFGSIEPELIGPFDTEEARDDHARKSIEDDLSDDYDTFWLDVRDGIPTMGSF